MLKTLFMTTAIAGLTLAPASWAQQERTPGEPGMEHHGGQPQGEKMQQEPRGDNAQPGKMQAPQRADENGMKGEPGAAPRSHANEQPNMQDERGSRQSQGRDERNPEGQSQREPRAAQGAHDRGGAQISSEQRTKLRTGFKGAQVREAGNIGITNVRVGASVPREVTEYWTPIPAPILAIVPEWSDYRVVRVGGEYLVIDPETFEVVYIFS